MALTYLESPREPATHPWDQVWWLAWRSWRKKTGSHGSLKTFPAWTFQTEFTSALDHYVHSISRFRSLKPWLILKTSPFLFPSSQPIVHRETLLIQGDPSEASLLFPPLPSPGADSGVVRGAGESSRGQQRLLTGEQRTVTSWFPGQCSTT